MDDIYILYFFKCLIILAVIYFSIVCSDSRNNIPFSIIILSFLSIPFFILGYLFNVITGCIFGGLFLGYIRVIIINSYIESKKLKKKYIISVIFGLICGFAIHSILYYCDYLFKIIKLNANNIITP